MRISDVVGPSAGGTAGINGGLGKDVRSGYKNQTDKKIRKF